MAKEKTGKFIDEKSSIKKLIQGEWISDELFKKNIKVIAISIVLIFFYISNRYTCQDAISQISTLQKELVDIRYEALTLSSDLLGSSRESQVKELVDTKGLGLELLTTPPYLIKVK